MNLHQIGKKYGTDKASHNYKGISFLDMYEPYLIKRKEDRLNILDIGVLKGGSVKMWKEYFPNSNIIGLDIDPNCSRYSEERIEIYIGSQDDENLRNDIIKKYQKMDLIVDDGSHVNELTTKTYNLYWPFLNIDGIYIIEDTHCCNVDLSNFAKSWPGMSYNKKDLEYNNLKGNSFDHFILNLTNKVIIEPFDGQIFNISYYPGTMIIIKK